MRFLPFAPDQLAWACVHFVHPVATEEAALPDPTAPLRHAGWVLARIDGGGVTGKAALLEALAGALRFPDYFGHNWDALAECLGDLSWLPAPGYALTIAGATTLWTRHPAVAGTLVEVWLQCAERWAGEGVPFHLVFEW